MVTMVETEHDTHGIFCDCIYRSKIKALSDEQETTLNVHRWRNLESSDPQCFEMINKIQSIQKRIISKNQEIVDKGD